MFQSKIAYKPGAIDGKSYFLQSNSASSTFTATIPPTVLVYDKNGNLISETGGRNASYRFDYANRLKQAAVGTSTQNYLYDHTGQRIFVKNYLAASSTSSSTSVFYPSKSFNAEYDNTGKLTKQTDHIYAGSLLIATIETINGMPKISYHLSDHLGSITITTDGNGAITELSDYFPYGNIRLDEGNSKEQKKYIGQDYDVATGLDYLNARYYNSAYGKFISQDPEFWSLNQQYFTDPQQWNSYSYARNNPIVISDPTGLWSLWYYTSAPKAGWQFGDAMGGFNGVSAYYNGKIGNYGWSYSCVEYAKRYMNQTYGISDMGAVGDPNNMWKSVVSINENLAKNK